MAYKNLIVQSENISEDDKISILTQEELEDEHKTINDINDDLDALLDKKKKLTGITSLTLGQFMTNMSNATMDVLQESVQTVFKKRKFKYQNKFRWWKRYSVLFSDLHHILNKEDRYIYFGTFVLLLSFLLNFLHMLHT
tara:strand:+ start:886 stop:1302 length:417 start_codon:yes stop_codon:yes gene_type:complete